MLFDDFTAGVLISLSLPIEISLVFGFGFLLKILLIGFDLFRLGFESVSIFNCWDMELVERN